MADFEPGNQHGLANRFQPGQSGNPAGYPEGRPNRGTLLRKMMAKEIDYKDPSTGQYARGTIEEAITLAMLAAASNGDVMAYKEIMDSVYGKVTDKVQVETTRKITRRIGGRTPEPPADGSPGT
jgi:hypothetical protein